MAYDAGMLGHVIAEINAKVAGGKVDKIYQPSRDEIVLLIRCAGAEHRLFVSALGQDSQCLHAGALCFRHPRDGRPVMVFAPLPEYFVQVIEKLERMN